MLNGKSKVKEEIEQLEVRLQAADVVNDPAFHEAYVADDIVFTDPQGRLISKSEIVSAHQPPGASKYSSFEVSDVQIKDFAAMAIVTARVDLGIDDFILPLRFTRVWLKRADQWQIVACHITPIA